MNHFVVETSINIFASGIAALGRIRGDTVDNFPAFV
jgi:hypothetical protein